MEVVCFAIGFALCWVLMFNGMCRVLRFSEWNERIVSYVCDKHYKLIGHESPEEMLKELQAVTHDPLCRDCGDKDHE